MNKYPKKISEEILHQNAWWAYKKDIFEKPNGEQGEYYYGETNGAVMIVAVRDDGRLVLTRQYRYLQQKFSIEFPCGGIKPGEDSVTAAKRELLEETGCEADEFVLVGSFEPSNGFVKDHTDIYIAHVYEQKEQQLDGTEQIGLVYRRPDEFSVMIRNQEISCGQTLAAWILAQNYFSAPKSEEVAPGFKILSDYFLG